MNTIMAFENQYKLLLDKLPELGDVKRRVDNKEVDMEDDAYFELTSAINEGAKISSWLREVIMFKEETKELLSFKDLVNHFLKQYLKGFDFRLMIWFWTGFRFGFAGSTYYRREWLTRYEKHGMDRFLSHMDYDSRATFKQVLDAWYKANLPLDRLED
jgi:hypothetical protein